MLNEAYDTWPGDIGSVHAYGEGNTRVLVLSVCTLTFPDIAIVLEEHPMK